MRSRFLKTKPGLLLAGLVIFAAPFAAQALSLPGIPPSGDPAFENNATLTLKRVSSGFTLTATLSARSGADMTFNRSGTVYNVSETNDSFVLTANFDKYGTLLSTSNVEIKGQLPTYPGTESSPLYRATLTDWNLGFSDGQLILGFETTKPSGWAKQFQCNASGCANESVYFHNFSNFQGYWNLSDNKNSNYNYWSNNKNGTIFKVSAHAITTVPLPAAAWLFGSGLLGFFGAGRRKQLGALPA